MDKVKVEFFHDVICSYCFPMSYKMRQLQSQMQNVEIVHRSFAVAETPDDYESMFGSREAAKEEILKHWVQAAENDELHRFNISGMRRETFPFPTSMNALIACKAAYFAAGDAGYWDVFDSLQTALFVHNRNVESMDVIEDCIKSTSVNFEQWKGYYLDSKTKDAVEKDFILVSNYGIDSVPCFIIDEKVKISGAQPFEQIIQAIVHVVKVKEQEE